MSGLATIALALSLALPAQVATQSQPIQDRDGTWWLSLTQGPSGDSKMARVMKEMFVSGLIDGTTTILSAMSPDESTYKKLSDIYLIPILDPAQIVDGMDEHYRDFKNRRDSVGTAFLKVINQIRARR